MSWRDKGLGGLASACFALAVGLLASAASLHAGEASSQCTKAEFETVVDDAAAALRELNAKNKPAFQERLRELKEKRGWSDDEFLKAAAPLVKDAEIEVFEKRSNELLSKISSMGTVGAKTPECNMLEELHGYMAALVETQTAKWSYMFGKLDIELGK